MGKDIKVSVIVPVYNVEAYVSRCLDSLLNQTLEDIEIIVVDDGSTDKSGAICDEYASKFFNIKVYHQNNYGLTCARRVGLEHCIGEYITFVDSDDWVNENMCEREYLYAKEKNAKILICDYSVVNGQDIEKRKGYFDDEISIEKYYSRLTPGYVWNKLYHCSLISKMMVSINVSQAEDICMLLPLVSYLESDNELAYLEESFYYYFQREKSSSNSDFFVESYAIDEYLTAIQYILEKHNKKYSDLVSFYCVQCMYWGINNPARACFRADYIEFLQNNLYMYILRNPYISRFPNIIKELIKVLIPANLVYSDLGVGENTASEQRCIDSWRYYARNFNMICINEENADFSTAPACVLNAYNAKKYDFVGEYFGLKYIYQHGGIFVSKKIKLNKALGEQRLNRAFFGYISADQIGADIWGSIDNNILLKNVLNTYEIDSIYNDSFLGLADRIQLELEKNYKLIPKGKETFLMTDLVKLYAKETLYEYGDENNVSQLYDMCDESVYGTDKVLVNKNYLSLLLKDIKQKDKNINDIRNEMSNMNTQINKLKKNGNMAKDNYEKEITKLKKEKSVNNDKEIVKIKKQLEEIIDEKKELEIRLVDKENDILLNKAAYENVINSTSWKVTSPIRKMLDFIKK